MQIETRRLHYHDRHQREEKHGNLPRFIAMMVLSAVPVICVSAQPAHAVDLAVTNIEVTQAIQTVTTNPATTNTIQLVAQRSTAVRATIVNLDGTAVPGVTGSLHVFVNGAEITPSAGVTPINAPFTVPVAPQRANENDTLNFERPAPSGITASSNVTFRVDVSPVAGETNAANNTLTTSALTAVNRTTPSLYFTRINWIGTGLPDRSLVQPGVGDAFVRGIFPVNDGDPNLYREGLFPSLPFNDDPENNGMIDLPEGNRLISFLASCRQLIVNKGLGASNNTFLFGWVIGNPISGNGLGQVSGFNAFGNSAPIGSQEDYAHELTHNFGRNHNMPERPLNQVGWDVGARLPNNPAGNNTMGRLKPMTLNDIMNPGRLTNQAWVDPTTYNALLGTRILSDAPGARGQPNQRVLVVQGIFDPTGSSLLRLKPAFRFPWASEPTLLPLIEAIPNTAVPEQITQAGFAVEVTDTAGFVTRVPFDPRVSDNAGNVEFGAFEVMVAVSPEREAESLRITDAQGQRTFAMVKRSMPPTITVLEPRPNQRLGNKTDVAWRVKGSDSDPARGRSLLYQIAYSPDGGSSWVPLAVDVPGTAASIVVDTTEIQQSNGNGVIRVFVGDGLNTALADVTDLSTTAAIYPPPE